MTSIPLRKLCLDGTDYFWQVRHRHARSGVSTPAVCSEVFSAFDSRFRGAALRILFPSGEDHGRGYPGASGEIVDYADPSWSLNLHRPRIARFLIETALAAGWSPSHGPRAHHIIANGYELLRAHRAALEVVLRESSDPPVAAGLPEDGRLFQDYRFEVVHVQNGVIEELYALVLDEDSDMEPCLLYLKVRGQPWQKCFLDVGSGFWEQWSDLQPIEETSVDDEIRLVDYAERFGLHGTGILRAYCEPEGEDLASWIRLVLTTGTLTLRSREPKGIEPCSYVTFQPVAKVGSQ